MTLFEQAFGKALNITKIPGFTLSKCPYTPEHGIHQPRCAMTSGLSAINLVLVGDNFPTSSLSARDFTFRNRGFVEKLRVGPLFQASSRNVEIQAFPERFQVAVDAPDDLDILCQGIAEVVDTFLEFVGRRTVRAVGHNAQVKIDPWLYESAVNALVRKDAAARILGVETGPSANVSLRSKVGNEDQLALTIGAETTPGAEGGVIDFNFNFNIRDSDNPDSLSLAIAHLRESLDHAERIVAAIREQTQEAAR